MSIIGTSIAAGVAQTAQQAQEVSRRREKRVSDQQRQVREIKEKLDLQQVAVEEDDTVETPIEMHIDAQLPEHQPPDEQAGLTHVAGAISEAEVDEESASGAESDDAPPSTPSTPGSDGVGESGGDDDGDGLYHHLDVTG